MALLSELTSELTDIRSDNPYRVLQFVCTVPNTTVVQFRPSAAPTTDVYAEISVGSVVSGSMSNIRAGMLVIFSSTSSYQASETFRTRVRKVSGTSVLYVGENSQTITTSSYITVVNTYEVQERLRHSETEVDWEITFRKLLPVETALPTAVALTNDVTAYTPTAVPKAMDASATSSFTHAWESSNASDTLDSGGSTASPTFTLAAGAHRWIRYTFTDSNGNSNYRVISVWTVPKDYSTVVALGFVGAGGDVADISFDAELGWTATVPAWDGINTLLNKTFCAIVNDEWLNDTRQSVRTNIAMCGWLQNESTSTRGDENFGQLSETRFTVEGVGHQLARQNIAPVTIFQTNTTPTQWDRIQDPTPGRMLTYRLSEYSTALNLCALALPADDLDFIGDDLTLTSSKALSDVKTISEGINAVLQFDVDGKLDLCRNLVMLDDTARNAADIVATFDPADMLSFEYEYDSSKTCCQVTVNAGMYDSNTGEYAVFEAIAPAVARESEGDPLAVSNQILTTDSSSADALSEARQRTANLFAYNNPTYTARGTLKGEWGFLVPDVGSWVKFDIAGTDTARGKVFGSSDRWQLVSISVSTNSLTGTREVSFVARHETQSTGAMVRANPVQNTSTITQAYFPPTTLPFSGVPTADGKWYNSRDTQPPATPDPPPPECQLLGVRPKSGNAKFSAAVATNYVTVKVRGFGRIVSEVRWTKTFNFTADDGGFSALFGNRGIWDEGQGWRAVPVAPPPNGDWLEMVQTDAGYITTTITSAEITVTGSTTSSTTAYLTLNGANIAAMAITSGSGATGTISVGYTSDELGIRWHVLPRDNSHRVTTLTLEGISTSIDDIPFDDPDTVTDISQYSDAFYYGFDASGGGEAIPHDVNNGLYIEDDQPDFPPYNSSHEYFLPLIQVTGLATVKLQFKYADFDLAEFTNWSLQAIICERDDP